MFAGQKYNIMLSVSSKLEAFICRLIFYLLCITDPLNLTNHPQIV